MTAKGGKNGKGIRNTIRDEKGKITNGRSILSGLGIKKKIQKSKERRRYGKVAGEKSSPE